MAAVGVNVNQQGASYIIGKDDTTYYAINCATGTIAYSGTDYATVYADALAAAGNGIVIDKTGGTTTPNHLQIKGTDPNVITHEVVAAPGQAEDIAEYKKSDGTVTFSLNKDGAASILTMAPTVRGGVKPDYIVFPQGESYYAKDGVTGTIIKTDTDAGVVINYCIELMIATGGSVHLTSGIFNINHLTHYNPETWVDVYYGIGIPGVLTGNVYGRFSIEGNGAPTWPSFYVPEPIPTNGTIINITAGAMAEVPNGKLIAGIYCRCPPDAFIHGTYVALSDLGVRLGNILSPLTHGIDLYYAADMEMHYVNVDFDTVTTGNFVVPIATSTGVVTIRPNMFSTRMDHVFATGFMYGFDFRGEHVICADCQSAHCVYPFVLGGEQPPNWPVTINKFIECQCKRSPNIATKPGALLQIDAYGLEYTNSGIWNRLGGATEGYPGAPGNARGRVNYESVEAGVGPGDIPFWEPYDGGDCGKNVITTNTYIVREKRGIATVLNGQASVTFTTGLGLTAEVVTLGAMHAEVADAIWSAPNATQITITVPSVVTADRTIAWYAWCKYSVYARAFM